VDWGIAQGHAPELPFDHWPVPPAAIDYFFLTHAHIDHTGRVPDLIDAGFAVDIYPATGTKCPDGSINLAEGYKFLPQTFHNTC
jgi:metallo-beta-lactamase family protein